jgi:IS30 family transposase
MTTQQHRKTARQFQIEERRRQVAIMVTQSYSEVEIAAKLGVDNSTISKDIRALKLVSQQFIYDITKSDFTYYYKQCLDAVKLVLRKQWEIAEKEQITTQDMSKAKILSDILSTVATINEYYTQAPKLHKSPMQMVYETENIGIRPGTPTHKMTAKEEEEVLKLILEGESNAAANVYNQQS